MAYNIPSDFKNASFSAYLSAPVSNVTGDGTIYNLICDTPLYNFGNEYNSSTGIMSSVKGGYYVFNVILCLTGVDATNTDLLIAWDGNTFNTRAYQIGTYQPGSTATLIFPAATPPIKLNPGDAMKVGIFVGGSTKNVSLFGQNPGAALATTCIFSGYKVAEL